MWAPVLHIGAEADINRDWFVSFDLRKLYLKTDASGFLGPQVATARVTLNPLLTSIAIGRRF
ncbi:OmpW family outer membrane protein [Burkholderia sp. BC1]|uniref:OmpW family outer membrane protein n=1 Tax=Burkholderia sp. BC1 TaxID=1095370 RepID=UPI0040447E3B